jgi:hypothetical protein
MLEFIEKVKPRLGKQQLISFTGKRVNKRKAKPDEIIINQFLIPLHNKAKRIKVEQNIAYMIRRKRARLDKEYLLTPKNKIIKKTNKIVKQLNEGGYNIERNGVVVKTEHQLYVECQDKYDFFQEGKLFKENRVLEYERYVRKHKIKTPSKTTSITRLQFNGIDELHETLKQIHQRQTNQYRLDIWLGYKLRNIETGLEREFIPSYNCSLFSTGSPIINTSINHILEDLNCENLVEKTKRINSKWSFDSFTEYVVLVTEIEQVLIGASIKLPDYIKKSKSIISFESVQNNLCFWFCLARHLNPNSRLDRLTSIAKTLFKDYYKFEVGNEYKGVEIEELIEIEKHFQLDINIYSYSKEQVTLERNSGGVFGNIMNLNLYSSNHINHFSLIIQIHNITNVVRCGDCGKFLSEFKKLKAHYFTCNKGIAQIEYVDGNYQPKATVFEDLESVGITVPKNNRFFPYFLFYDFETYLLETPTKDETTGLQYEGEHQLLSISIIGSEETKPVFIPVTGTPLEALEEMLTN